MEPQHQNQTLKGPMTGRFGDFYTGFSGPVILYLSPNAALVQNYSHYEPVL